MVGTMMFARISHVGICIKNGDWIKNLKNGSKRMRAMPML
jgi:hypothetical protein